MDISNLTETLFKFNLPERLRQRLSQRPNCAEAASELYVLSRQLENDDLRTFAAACAEGVAACEGTAEHPVAEAEAFLRSARLHIEEEKETYDMSLPTMWDSLYFAIDCINKATDIFEQLGATHLAVTSLLELGKAMLHLARPHDAVQTYQKALELNKARNGTRERLVILRALAEAYIQAGCLVDALTTYEEMVMVSGILKISPSKVFGWYRELGRKCELRQLLILMIVQPSPRRLSPYHSQMLECYQKPVTDVAAASPADGPATATQFVTFLDPLKFLHVKDFALAVGRKDFRRLLEASEKLVCDLDDMETAFVDYLVDLIPHPSDNN